jgi:hypothetical protein
MKSTIKQELDKIDNYDVEIAKDVYDSFIHREQVESLIQKLLLARDKQIIAAVKDRMNTFKYQVFSREELLQEVQNIIKLLPPLTKIEE